MTSAAALASSPATISARPAQLSLVGAEDRAQVLARRFGPLDVHRSKRFENVWASDSIDDGFMRSSTHFVIDQRQVDLTLDEQAYLLARRLMALPP